MSNLHQWHTGVHHSPIPPLQAPFRDSVFEWLSVYQKVGWWTQYIRILFEGQNPNFSGHSGFLALDQVRPSQGCLLEHNFLAPLWASSIKYDFVIMSSVVSEGRHKIQHHTVHLCVSDWDVINHRCLLIFTFFFSSQGLVCWYLIWTWVWASSRSWWWTGRPGILHSMRLQSVRDDWATELTVYVIIFLRNNPKLRV